MSLPIPTINLFPLAEYTEDQNYARTILTTHVLHRGFQTGAAVGLAAGTVRAVFSRLQRGPPQSTATFTTSATTTAPTTRPSGPPISSPVGSTAAATLLRSTARGGLVTSLAMGAILPLYMSSVSGEDESDAQYAWQDRAYRLLHNEGQVSVDRWSVAGMVMAGVSGLFAAGPAMTVLTLAGRLGVGSLAGVVSRGVWKETIGAKEKTVVANKEEAAATSGGAALAS